LGVAAKVGIVGKMPEAEQARRHGSTQRAVKIQQHAPGRHNSGSADGA
jgi:hypothetical protein